MDIVEYCKTIITGVGGLHDFEKYELATPRYERDVATAIWVIQCLANPKDSDSENILNAILERRKGVARN